MKNKKIITQLNKELNALPVPNVLKAVQANSKIIVKKQSEEKQKQGFKIPAFFKVVLSLVLVISVGIWGFLNGSTTTPTLTTVTIDINPSVELTVDEDDKIYSANAINDDAETLLNGLTLENKSLDEAVELILNKAVALGKIDNTAINSIENAIMFSVNNNSETVRNNYQNKIQNTLNNYLQNQNINCNIIYEEYTEEMLNQFNQYVNSNGNANVTISPAKYNYIVQIVNHCPALAGLESTLANMSVAELYKILNDSVPFENDDDLIQDIIDGIIGNNSNFNNGNQINFSGGLAY